MLVLLNYNTKDLMLPLLQTLHGKVIKKVAKIITNKLKYSGDFDL